MKESLLDRYITLWHMDFLLQAWFEAGKWHDCLSEFLFREDFQNFN